MSKRKIIDLTESDDSIDDSPKNNPVKKIQKNTQDKFNFEKFFRACQFGYNDELLECIDAGININMLDSGRRNAIYIACQFGKTDILNTLLSQKGIDMTMNQKIVPFMVYVIQKNYHDIVLEFYNHGIDVVALYPNYDALNEACLMNRTEIVSIFLKSKTTNVNGIVSQKNQYSPFGKIIFNRNLVLLRAFKSTQKIDMKHEIKQNDLYDMFEDDKYHDMQLDTFNEKIHDLNRYTILKKHSNVRHEFINEFISMHSDEDLEHLFNLSIWFSKFCLAEINKRNWPRIKLVLVGHKDKNSTLCELPFDIIKVIIVEHLFYTKKSVNK